MPRIKRLLLNLGRPPFAEDVGSPIAGRSLGRDYKPDSVSVCCVRRLRFNLVSYNTYHKGLYARVDWIYLSNWRAETSGVLSMGIPPTPLVHQSSRRLEGKLRSISVDWPAFHQNEPFYLGRVRGRFPVVIVAVVDCSSPLRPESGYRKPEGHKHKGDIGIYN